MSNPTPDRIEEELKKWQKREENVRLLFRPGTTNERHFLKTMLGHFEGLHRKYSKDANLDERITLKVLKGENVRLKRLLYPNFFQRMARNLAVAAGNLFKRTEPGKHAKAVQHKNEYGFRKPVVDIREHKNYKTPGEKVGAAKSKDKGIDLLPKNDVKKSNGLKVK